MDNLPSITSDLALILMLAGIATIIFKRLGQPAVLGYIVAGFLCGPHFGLVPTVTDVHSVEAWAEIGVIVLMFTLGLEFSFKKILSLGSAPFIAALVIIVCMICLGSIAGRAFGWSSMNSLFLGGMLAMSSTTIIFKALDDLELRQQRFADAVLGVLVVEDILGIVPMVILSMLAVSNRFEGAELAVSMMRLVSVLVVWFIVGMFLIPTFLRVNRRWLSKETLLIVSMGLCFFMVVLAAKMDYSAAFGAFMMGSILAETVEAESIEHVVAPVKDLFGAVFFVSVGMMVDPAVLVQYWLPILVLVVTIIVGQAVFGTTGYLLSGRSLKVAVQCGFSMMQIGEFAFIIASLGVSLGVTASFLYPVVVAVSVITTFLTPYMIRLSGPVYNYLQNHLPPRLMERLQPSVLQSKVRVPDDWSRLLGVLGRQVGAYALLCLTVIAVMLGTVRGLLDGFLHSETAGAIVCTVLTVACLSPFLRAIVMRKNHSEVFKALWNRHLLNKILLVLVVLARCVLAAAFVAYVLSVSLGWGSGLCWALAFGLMLAIMASERVKWGSRRLESIFLQNLNSREALAEREGRRAPAYEAQLLSRDVHLSLLQLPMNTALAGKSLRQLGWARLKGVMVAAVLRDGERINSPGGDVILYPGDRLQVLGSDEKLRAFAMVLQTDVKAAVEEDPNAEMILKAIVLTASSDFVGKTVAESRLREDFRCMLVGIEGRSASAERTDDVELEAPRADRRLEEGDTLWIVGERRDLFRLMAVEG